MENVINHGDSIALKEVDPTWFPLGEIYAIITYSGFRMVKRISHSKDDRCYLLISENSDKERYPNQKIPKKQIYKLFKVVGALKVIG